jgi:twitching motility two-component system response regulator PilG
LTFPQDASEEPATQPSFSGQRNPPLPPVALDYLFAEQTRTVLVVDDSPTVRKIVQMMLQREHIRVITASDGLSALTSVADEVPAVILLDTQLPRMDGYHICQIIRKNLRFRQIPIVMLSGKDGLFDKMRGRLAGTTDFLMKPFNSQQLVQTVKKYLLL